MNKRCRNCMFANIVAEKLPEGDTYQLVRLECRRYAPRMISGSGTGWSDTLFPEMMPEDWCGEWKRREKVNE